MIVSFSRLGRRLHRSGLSVVLVLLFSAAATFAASATFDIPAQPAPAALDLFIKQSGAQVVYLLADVKDAKTNGLKGAYEPAAALTLLLKDTGLDFSERKPGQFTVGRVAPAPGSVKGSLTGEGGKSLPDVLVAIRETGQSTRTDASGQYVFPKLAAGTYVLVATTPGYQPLHITDVTVGVGRDLTLGKEQLRKPLGEVTNLEPMVVRADEVTELDKVEVTGRREDPFSTGNLDLPRTINDVQAYQIFDSRTLRESGAVNIEDFLKQRLSMNTSAQSIGQGYASTYGQTSWYDPGT